MNGYFDDFYFLNCYCFTESTGLICKQDCNLANKFQSVWFFYTSALCKYKENNTNLQAD